MTKKFIPILALILVNCVGCQTINSLSAPKELKDAVARQAAVNAEVITRIEFNDQGCLINPTKDELMQYLQQNSDSWNEIDRYWNNR